MGYAIVRAAHHATHIIAWMIGLLKKHRTGDTASGLFLILIGAITLGASSTIAKGAVGRLHPNILPVTLGVVLLIGGVWLIIRAQSKQNQDKVGEWPDPAGWRNWGIAFAMMALYAAIIQPLGFVFTTAVFITAFIWHFGKCKALIALAWGCGTAGFLYGLFIGLLQMNLPIGPFGF
jgi:putative tricarboxylic transport membrane protein